MLYLGIDQHARQITISLRDENGDVIEARQVSTQPEKIHAFFQQTYRGAVEGRRVVRRRAGSLRLQRLADPDAARLPLSKVILIQPEHRKKRKTDRRDAAALSELLWVNRKSPAGRQAGPRPAASRNCLYDGSREPATDDAPQGSRSSADSHRESNQAHSAASQSAMGHADQDCSPRCGPSLG